MANEAQEILLLTQALDNLAGTRISDLYPQGDPRIQAVQRKDQTQRDILDRISYLSGTLWSPKS